MAALAPCPACARHVRTDEPRCPFCDAPTPGAKLPAARPVPHVAIGRAAMLFGAAFAAAPAASCTEALADPTPGRAHHDHHADAGEQPHHRHERIDPGSAVGGYGMPGPPADAAAPLPSYELVVGPVDADPPDTLSSPATIARVLRVADQGVRRCFDDARQHEPRLAGRLAVTFTINASGAVVPGTMHVAGMPSAPSLAGCVADSLKTARFLAPSQSVDVETSITFALRPG